MISDPDNRYYYRIVFKTIRTALLAQGVQLETMTSEDYGRVKFPRKASWAGYCPELNRQVMLIEAPFLGCGSLERRRAHRILIDCPECRTHNELRFGRWVPAGHFARHLAGAAHRRAVAKVAAGSPPWRVPVSEVARSLLTIQAREGANRGGRKFRVRLQIGLYSTCTWQIGDSRAPLEPGESWGMATLPRRGRFTRSQAQIIAKDLLAQCVAHYTHALTSVCTGDLNHGPSE